MFVFWIFCCFLFWSPTLFCIWLASHEISLQQRCSISNWLSVRPPCGPAVTAGAHNYCRLLQQLKLSPKHVSAIWHQYKHSKLHNVTSNNGSCYFNCVRSPLMHNPVRLRRSIRFGVNAALVLAAAVCPTVQSNIWSQFFLSVFVVLF